MLRSASLLIAPAAGYIDPAAFKNTEAGSRRLGSFLGAEVAEVVLVAHASPELARGVSVIGDGAILEAANRSFYRTVVCHPVAMLATHTFVESVCVAATGYGAHPRAKSACSCHVVYEPLLVWRSRG